MPSERMRTVIWWIYYSLFLGLCISILVMVLRYAVSWAFTGDEKLTGAHILYGVAVGMMIFGLLSLCIAYLTKTICTKIKGALPCSRGGISPSAGSEEQSFRSG